jgi:hypothetical protein
MEGQVPVFISTRNRVAQLYLRALDSLSVASYDSQSSGGGILTRIHTGYLDITIPLLSFNDTDRTENDTSSNSSDTFLLSRCLAMLKGLTYRHSDWQEGFKKYGRCRDMHNKYCKESFRRSEVNGGRVLDTLRACSSDPTFIFSN